MRVGKSSLPLSSIKRSTIKPAESINGGGTCPAPPVSRRQQQRQGRRQPKQKMIQKTTTRQEQPQPDGNRMFRILLMSLSFLVMIVVTWQHTKILQIGNKRQEYNSDAVDDNSTMIDPQYIFDFPPPDSFVGSSATSRTTTRGGATTYIGVGEDDSQRECSDDDSSDDDTMAENTSPTTVTNNTVRTTCQLHNKTIQLLPSSNSHSKVQSHFIIIGAQKSGTTALYNMLSAHPKLHSSNAMETHFFDWYYPSSKQKQNWMHERNISTSNDFDCAISKEYWELFFNFSTSTARTKANAFTTSSNAWNSNKNRRCQKKKRKSHNIITFEKTPSYMFLTRIPELIYTALTVKQRLPTKIVVILRNPIERAISQYRMGHEVKQGQTFDELVHDEIASMKFVNLTNAPSLFTSTPSSTTTSKTAKKGSTQPKRYNFTKLDDTMSPLFQLSMNTSSEWYTYNWWRHYRRKFRKNYIQRSMYVVQLQHWIQYFPLNETMLVLNYEQFANEPHFIYQSILDFVFGVNTTSKTPTTPFIIRDDDFFTKRHNTLPHKKPVVIHDETRQYLSLFFRPYNDQLADLLGEHWRNIWE